MSPFVFQITFNTIYLHTSNDSYKILNVNTEQLQSLKIVFFFYLAPKRYLRWIFFTRTHCQIFQLRVPIRIRCNWFRRIHCQTSLSKPSRRFCGPIEGHTETNIVNTEQWTWRDRNGSRQIRIPTCCCDVCFIDTRFHLKIIHAHTTHIVMVQSGMIDGYCKAKFDSNIHNAWTDRRLI